MGSDDAALIAALEASVVVYPSDLPCQWPQWVPCMNIATLVASDGSMLCHPHFELFEREMSGRAPLRTVARP